MSNFDQAINATLAYEGIYSNRPSDKGGETLLGISRVNFPNWEGWKLVDGLPKPIKVVPPKLMEMVKSFYFNVFWKAAKCDQFTDDKIAAELFDFAVNAGQPRAVRVLQSALNLLNNNAKRYTDIKEDGVIGPITISLTNAHPERDVLLSFMKVLRASFYINVALKDPSQEEYVKGWFCRAIS